MKKIFIVTAAVLLLLGCKKESVPPHSCPTTDPASVDSVKPTPSAVFVSGRTFMSEDFTTYPNIVFMVRMKGEKGTYDNDSLSVLIQEKRDSVLTTTAGYPKRVYGSFNLDTTFRTPSNFNCNNGYCSTYEVIFTVTGSSGKSATRSIKVTAL